MNTLNTSNCMIFYADDDADDRELFEEAVKEINKQAVINILDSGDRLLAALNNEVQQPSIVFLDINMPGTNGYQVLNKIRNSDSLKNIPVIMLSTSSDRQTIESCFKYGASYYITKPNTFKALKDSINAALEINWNTFKPDLANFTAQNN